MSHVLFISDPNTPDYGAQYLFDGFCDLLGPEHVVEWPHNPYHHVAPGAEMSGAELSWPTRSWRSEDVRELLSAGAIDLIVMSSVRVGAMRAAEDFGIWLACSKRGMVVCDFDDAEPLTCTAALPRLREFAPVTAVFKRELLPGRDYGVEVLPLPFGYPRGRIVTDAIRADDAPIVFYRAHDWGWPADSIRHRMVQALRDAFGNRADVGLSEEQRAAGLKAPGRLSVADYRRRLAATQCGLALNQGGGSDTNRYWETVAAGCVLVTDRPRHVIPNDFEDGTEACVYTSVDEAVEQVRLLASDPDRRLQIANAGLTKLRAHHTTGARARTVLDAAGINAPRRCS